jgi:hypothetical protein
MQKPAGAMLWNDDTEYLDRIWKCTQLSWHVRSSLLELHREGVLDHGELSDNLLSSLNSSGMYKANGLQLLDRFRRQVGAIRARSTERHPGGWKSSALLELLGAQVGC